MEGLNKKNTDQIEKTGEQIKEQRNTEFKNERENKENLLNKINEKLNSSPIIFSDPMGSTSEIKSIENISISPAGDGGDISISFKNDFFSVNKDGAVNTHIFREIKDKDSFHNFLDIMQRLINDSG